MVKMPRFLPCLVATLSLAVPATAKTVTPVDFSRQIRPILSENCFFCHGPDENKREAGLRLDEETGAKSDNDGVIAVVPGDPEKSALFQRIISTDPDDVMPPPKQHKTIPVEQVALLKQWIVEGAPWGNHWSYEPVKRPKVPATAGHPVDAFLIERLQREGLSFSHPADAATLVRRIALDLTGLPPTLDELQQIKDPEAAIDHYLAKPAYGEHWARQWLDLARYADSSGYPSDQPREIWAFRDWVIDALNANMPFDQFTIEQLAGDLLPNPVDDQLIATAFHRNTMTQNEGGTNDEEFRVAAIVDRVNTTMAVWMGTTMACAQCHTHKYDPITHHEYYAFYDFLNQTADADKKDEAPIHELIEPSVKKQRDAWSALAKKLEKELAQIAPETLEGYDSWIASKPKLADAKLKAIADKPVAKRSTDETQKLKAHYVRHVSPALKAQRVLLVQVNKDLARTKPTTIPVMQELPANQRRESHVQLRGDWQSLGDQVKANTPAAFPPLPPKAERNRLTLAKWIVSRENPLAARVTVNRLWESVFGAGIVQTSEEFGSQGELPFHPELLDWLAAEFMDSGWDIQHILRLLLTSRAFQQDSATTPELNEHDPDNRLLARGPRFRPTGELLRDQALAVSGLLSAKTGGPPVRPLAPKLGLKAAFGRTNDWVTSEGEDRHRRSIYTEIQRNSPYASFMTFDGVNREVCTIRRNRTNTPLQAFVTLNDPVFIETHQAMARRLVHEGGPTIHSRLRHAFQLCVARDPSSKEAITLTRLFNTSLQHFKSDPAAAGQMATDPLGPAPKGSDLPELAAWTTVANVIMNLDEFLMRR